LIADCEKYNGHQDGDKKHSPQRRKIAVIEQLPHCHCSKQHPERCAVDGVGDCLEEQPASTRYDAHNRQNSTDDQVTGRQAAQPDLIFDHIAGQPKSGRRK
jgi:hypothetical protein